MPLSPCDAPADNAGMLPDPDKWRWIEGDDAAYLHMHYVCVGNVQRRGDRYVALVRNHGRERTREVESLAEGRERIEAYWQAALWWRTVPRRG